MAKVSGPLFSMSALGAFAGAMVFSAWKGRPTVRQLVRPSNPHSADQEAARNRVRATGHIQHVINLLADIESGQTETDRARLIAAVPAGFAWNGWLVDNIIGAGGLTYAAAQTAWAALTGGQKTAWSTAAEGLSTPFAAVAQTVAGGGAGTSLTSGNVFFLYRYGLSVAGLAATPDGTPPTYA